MRHKRPRIEAGLKAKLTQETARGLWAVSKKTTPIRDHQNEVVAWTMQMMAGAEQVFASTGSKAA